MKSGRGLVRVACAILLALVVTGPAFAAGDRPALQPLRYDDDFRFLADPSRGSDFWDPVKYVALGRMGYLSLGGEARERFEAYSNEFFHRAADSEYLLQRYLVHADWHATDWLRLFLQLQSSLEDGRNVPRPTDRDSIDVHQAFVDFAAPLPFAGAVTMRIGRQEMSYGSERLVSVREGTNNRRAFDAVRLLFEGEGWKVDAFFGSPVEADHGAFDDRYVQDSQFWGAYATVPLKPFEGFRLDFYYLGLHNADAVFAEGPGNEKRQTIGARLFGQRGGWDVNHEVLYQFGSYDGGGISAWSVATDHGFTFGQAWASPRVGLKAAIASGDRNPADGDLQTLNPLFPRGNYFTEASLLGPQNFFDVHPCLKAKPFEGWSFEAGADFYWRESLDDGIYTPGGGVIYRGDTSDARFVGTDLSTITTWQATSHLGLSAAYTHFFAGAFIDDNDGADTDYVAVWATYRF